MTVNLQSLASSAVAGAVQSSAGVLRSKLLSSAIHLMISLAVAGCVVTLVYLGWYPDPLDSVVGVGEILFMLLAVDVTLGPLLTLIVFDRRKKNLSFDLSCIAVMQIIALIYGLYTVEAGRPHYLVFVKDRFEVVSRVELLPADRIAAAGNRAADVDWFGPRIVSAAMPTSEQERADLLFESVLGGRDAQHFPVRYRDYVTQASQAAAKGRPLDDLRAINPDNPNLLQSAIDHSGSSEDRLRFLPVKGPRGDASMLVNASTGAIVQMVNLKPWR